MRIDVNKGNYGWHVIDAATGRRFKKVIWADDETGEYEVYVTNEKGAILLNAAGDGPQQEVRRGRIRLEPPQSFADKNARAALDYSLMQTFDFDSLALRKVVDGQPHVVVLREEDLRTLVEGLRAAFHLVIEDPSPQPPATPTVDSLPTKFREFL